MHNDYADRKNGRKPVEYLHPDLDEALGDTYGLMVYQESMMRVAQKVAGYTLAEADNLRKACLPAGTRMLTRSRGYVPIEQVMGLTDRRVQTIDTRSGTTPIRRRCQRLVGRYEASAAAHHVDGLRDRGDHRAPVSRGGDVATARRDPPRCARRRGRPYTH